jgi:Ohr subfamily peroxiredoxin
MSVLKENGEAAVVLPDNELFEATPEHLFAAGYAACFGGALDFVGKQHKKDTSKASVTADVSIGPRDVGGFGLAVKLHVKDPTLLQAELEALANEAHEKICPHPNATRGNVDVQLDQLFAGTRFRPARFFTARRANRFFSVAMSRLLRNGWSSPN